LMDALIERPKKSVAEPDRVSLRESELPLLSHARLQRWGGIDGAAQRRGTNEQWESQSRKRNGIQRASERKQRTKEKEGTELWRDEDEGISLPCGEELLYHSGRHAEQRG